VHVFPLGSGRMATVRAFAQAWSAVVGAGSPEADNRTSQTVRKST